MSAPTTRAHVITIKARLVLRVVAADAAQAREKAGDMVRRHPERLAMALDIGFLDGEARAGCLRSCDRGVIAVPSEGGAYFLATVPVAVEFELQAPKNMRPSGIVQAAERLVKSSRLYQSGCAHPLSRSGGSMRGSLVTVSLPLSLTRSDLR